MTPKGLFVTSLDFELLYGLSDSEDQTYWIENVLGGRIAIPKILELFKAHEIHATWATVGMLMASDKQELQAFFPDQKPQYKNANYNLELIGKNETDDPCHFAGSLIEKIKDVPFQEIASHTFSHYFCSKQEQNIEMFCDDINSAVKIAQKKGFTLKSLVFPKNEVQSEYAAQLTKYGIRTFRGTQESRLHGTSDKESLLIRGLRLLDSYINISGMNCYTMDQLSKKDGVINIPASRFLRPYSEKLHCLERLKLRRVKGQMKYAAQNGLIFHLWWHPHNFGRNTEKNLKNLEELLHFYQELNSKYGFESANMYEIVEKIDEHCNPGFSGQ